MCFFISITEFSFEFEVKKKGETGRVKIEKHPAYIGLGDSKLSMLEF